MSPARILFELETLAGRLGITVRTEPFGRGVLRGRGGLCWVRGRPLVVMDASLPATDRIATLAAALAQLEVDVTPLAPAVRRTIEEARRGAATLPRVTHLSRTTGPGLARGRPPRRG